jgi:Super-infection exclusion protein B
MHTDNLGATTVDISKLLDFLKQPASILLVLGLAGLAVLCLPDKAAVALGFTYFRTNYLHWVSLATIICLGLAVVGFTKEGFDRITRWWQYSNAKKTSLQYLQSLPPQERFYLAYCLSRRTNTIRLTIIDPAGGSLCGKGLLVKVGGVGNMLVWPHIIPDFVWRHIQKNPDAIVSHGDMRTLEDQFQAFERETNRNNMF